MDMDESQIIEPNNFMGSNHEYQGFDIKPFNYSKTQQNKTGYNILNPQAYKNKYSKDFDRIQVEGQTVYITSKPDGSVKSNFHNGQYTLMDVPYRDSGLAFSELDKMYSDEFNEYKTGYRNYNNIEGGDIIYYTNKQNEEPFFSPVFSSDFSTTSVMYKDPMGGLTPQYIRKPNKDTNKITPRKTFDYSLSWIEDSNEMREDIIARQLQKLNKNRWDQRWAPEY